MANTLQYEIKEHIATIAEHGGGDYAVELNFISFNGAPAKYDLRKWDKRGNRMLKGVTLSREEAEAVAAALCGHFAKNL